MLTSFQTLQPFHPGAGRTGYLHSLPALEKAGIGPISRLPHSIRIVLESVLRNCDGKKVGEQDVRNLANWNAKQPINEEIPFVVARIVLQDFTGVPLLVDLAAMRAVVARLMRAPKIIEPLVPVDLVVDHSVQVDFAGSAQALRLNMDMEFARNGERYQFLKWGQQAFKTFGVVPPGIGIIHQVNLEYLAKGVLFQEGAVDGGQGTIYYPDSLVGTDSHTTMINGLGIVGWGVGGIEAEAGMLGQPVYFLTPEVVGVHLTGALREGVTATDLALHITQMLRARKVVGKFVEFYGEGAATLPLTDRATIANMAPEYGATMGFFPVDAESVAYLRFTGRTEEQCAAFEAYFRAQEMFGMPTKGQIDYSVDLDLNLTDVQPSVAGPKRPQDRLDLPKLGDAFRRLMELGTGEGGYGKSVAGLSERFPVHLEADALPSAATLSNASSAATTDTGAGLVADGGKLMGETVGHSEMITNRPTATPINLLESTHEPEFKPGDTQVGHGSVLIASITSCTNTSNPSVMLGAGLLAKKAVELGLRVDPAVKTSLAPGSRVVTDYPRQERAAALPRPARFPGRRLRLHDLHRQFRSAAPEDRGGDHLARPRGGVGLERQPQFRGARASEHQGELPDVAAAGSGVRARGPRGPRPIQRPHRQGQGRRRSLPARHLAEPARDPAGDERRAQARGVPPALLRLRRAESEVERNSFHRRRRLFLRRGQRLYSGAAVLPGFRDGTRAHRRDQGRAAVGNLRGFRDHRPYLARGRDQSDLTGGSVPHRAGRRTQGLQFLRQPPRQ